MKKLALLFGVALAAATLAHGQTVNQGAPLVLFTNQTLTNVWTAGASVDLQSYDSFSLATVITNKGGVWPTADVAKLKFQWSDDNVVWRDESVLVAGTATSSDQPYTVLARSVQIPLASPTVNYVERFRRAARYFRPSVQSTNVFTSGTISVQIKQMNNQN